MKKIIHLICVILTLVLLSNCKKKEDPEPEPAPTPTPTPVVNELSFRVVYRNPNPDTLIPIPGIDVTIFSGSLNQVFYYTDSLHTKKSDAKGLVKFNYNELKNIGITGSTGLQVVAHGGILYGSYLGTGYLAGDGFLFDDRNTYQQRDIPVKVYASTYFNNQKKWKLVYASVNSVTVDVSGSCNKDDYMIYSEMGLAKFTYRDSTNACSGFPSPSAQFALSFDAASNPTMNGNYNLVTKKIDYSAITFPNNNGSPPSFWGYNMMLSILKGDTLKITSETVTNYYPVIKKFVPME